MPPGPTKAFVMNHSRGFRCRCDFEGSGGDASGVDNWDGESGLVSLKAVDDLSLFDLVPRSWFFSAVDTKSAQKFMRVLASR